MHKNSDLLRLKFLKFNPEIATSPINKGIKKFKKFFKFGLKFTQFSKNIFKIKQLNLKRTVILM